MRLFAGIAVPAPQANSLAVAARMLLPAPSGALHPRWTTPPDMHVTLSFLGEVRDAQLPEIDAALAAIRGDSCDIAIAQPEFFRGSGALVASVRPSRSLAALAGAVAAAMEGCGIPREGRPYRPHITLARIRGGRGLHLSAPHWTEMAFLASAFHLYRSHLGARAGHYEILRSYALEGA